MNIIFKHIRIENFLSLGNVELDLEDRGYTLISGINKNPDDNAKSNGSGKSALFDAIVWCLTGETIRGISSCVVNINSTEGCAVELTFICNGVNYRIIRSREHHIYGTSLKIFIEGEDKSGKGLRDTEQLLNQYLPDISSNFLGSVIVLGQGLPQRFTNNTPSGRKEILENLSKSDFMIEDIKYKLSSRQTILNNSLREYEDKILISNSELKSLNNFLSQANDSLKSLKNEQEYSDIISKTLLNIEDIDKKIQSTNDVYNKELNDLNKLNQEKSQQEFNIKQERSNITNKYIKDKSDIEANLKIIKAQINNLKSDIEKLKSISDICPTCGQKIPGVYKPDISKEIEKLNSLILEENNLNKSLLLIEDKEKSDIGQIDNNGHQIIIEYTNKIYNLNGSLQEKKNYLTQLEDNKKSLEKTLIQAQSDKENLLKIKNNLHSTIKDLTSQIEDLNKKILYDNDEKVELQNRLDVINKMATLAKRDFRGCLLSNVISYIDKKSKEYCKDIFNTDKINFQLDRNNILISYNGKPYENLSGGEKQKIDIIIQFSIRDMLCKFSNFSSNIIVLDEVFDNIDSLGCEKVINLISTKLNDIESIFIITHHSDIPISADSTISIIKDERGISNLR